MRISIKNSLSDRRRPVTFPVSGLPALDPGRAYLVDSEGKYIVDSEGKYITVPTEE